MAAPPGSGSDPADSHLDGSNPLGARPLDAEALPSPPPPPTGSGRPGADGYLDVPAPKRVAAPVPKPVPGNVDPASMGAQQLDTASLPAPAPPPPPVPASTVPLAADGVDTPFRFTAAAGAETVGSPFFSDGGTYVDHRPWSTVLLVLAWISVGLFGVAAVGFAFASTQLSAALAAYSLSDLVGMLAFALLAAALLYVGWAMLLWWGRRRADEGHPMPLFIVTVVGTVVGGLAVLSGLVGLLVGGGDASTAFGLTLQVLVVSVYARTAWLTRPGSAD